MLSHCVRKKGGPCSHASHTLKGVWLARCMQCAHAVPGLPQNSGYATADHGWATVEEYVEDELAEDSDDEKCLFRPKARAGRKAKAAQAAKLKKRRSMASRKPQSSGMPASIASLNSQQLAQPQAWPQPATGRNAYSTVASQS